MMKRIMLLLLNRHVEQLMTGGEEFSKIQELTHILKQISDFPQCKDTPNSKLLKDYYKSEVYAEISYVNNTYSQIANGDIFEIEGDSGKKTNYMLVCQPCNLELRGNASRKSSDFVYLLPIENIFIATNLESKTQVNKLNRQKYITPLHNVHNCENKCVNWSGNVRINPQILDLVSFNKEGKAIIDLTKDKDNLEEANIMQQNMLIHYQNIHSKISKHANLYKCIRRLAIDVLNEADRLDILEMLKNPFEMCKEGLINIDYNEENNIIDYKVRRIARYKEPL